MAGEQGQQQYPLGRRGSRLSTSSSFRDSQLESHVAAHNQMDTSPEQLSNFSELEKVVRDLHSGLGLVFEELRKIEEDDEGVQQQLHKHKQDTDLQLAEVFKVMLSVKSEVRALSEQNNALAEKQVAFQRELDLIKLHINSANPLRQLPVNGGGSTSPKAVRKPNRTTRPRRQTQNQPSKHLSQHSGGSGNGSSHHHRHRSSSQPPHPADQITSTDSDRNTQHRDPSPPYLPSPDLSDVSTREIGAGGEVYENRQTTDSIKKRHTSSEKKQNGAVSSELSKSRRSAPPVPSASEETSGTSHNGTTTSLKSTSSEISQALPVDRATLAEDILASEIAYINDLQALVNHYYKPCRKQVQFNDETFINSIFPPVLKAMKDRHLRFWDKLRKSGSDAYGHAFAMFSEEKGILYCYHHYFTQLPNAISCINGWAKQDANFDAFLKRQQQMAGKDVLTLLLAPTRHISELAVALKRLSESTGKKHPDYFMVESAYLRVMTSIEDHSEVLASVGAPSGVGGSATNDKHSSGVAPPPTVPDRNPTHTPNTGDARLGSSRRAAPGSTDTETCSAKDSGLPSSPNLVYHSRQPPQHISSSGSGAHDGLLRISSEDSFQEHNSSLSGGLSHDHDYPHLSTGGSISRSKYSHQQSNGSSTVSAGSYPVSAFTTPQNGFENSEPDHFAAYNSSANSLRSARTAVNSKIPKSQTITDFSRINSRTLPGGGGKGSVYENTVDRSPVHLQEVLNSAASAHDCFHSSSVAMDNEEYHIHEDGDNIVIKRKMVQRNQNRYSMPHPDSIAAAGAGNDPANNCSNFTPGRGGYDSSFMYSPPNVAKSDEYLDSPKLEHFSKSEPKKGRSLRNLFGLKSRDKRNKSKKRAAAEGGSYIRPDSAASGFLSQSMSDLNGPVSTSRQRPPSCPPQNHAFIAHGELFDPHDNNVPAGLVMARSREFERISGSAMPPQSQPQASGPNFHPNLV